MIRNVSYKARKRFKYLGKQVQIGDVWEPTGHKGDDAIIRSAYVYRLESAVNQSEGNTVRMGITSEDAKPDPDKVVVKPKPRKRVGRPPKKTVSSASKTPPKASSEPKGTG